ncbi:hypothetical protein ATZ36_05190 [Candidatus Endomicrobiellum trichonymphae]|uniref:Uncharacterized protein n=1 Tax=Endomicrobium trichonymphae TaxID=1408204 RepID=A0A1E5IIE6_ENDTX|nr:hypothetical protein ATZ36_05190 [Candidatus Endomicrobium trichonymphae]
MFEARSERIKVNAKTYILFPQFSEKGNILKELSPVSYIQLTLLLYLIISLLFLPQRIIISISRYFFLFP